MAYQHTDRSEAQYDNESTDDHYSVTPSTPFFLIPAGKNETGFFE